MKKYDYIPNNNILLEFIRICDEGHHPVYLKAVIDEWVLNKSVRLSQDNFTKYIQIISNFKETEEYVQNILMNSSSLGYLTRVDYYEYIIFNQLLNGDIDALNDTMKQIFERIVSDYKNEASQYIFQANIQLLRIFNDYYENIHYSKKLGLEPNRYDNKLINIWQSSKSAIIESFDKLAEDSSNESIKTIIKYFENTGNADKLNNIYRSLLESSKINLISKDNFINFLKLIEYKEIYNLVNIMDIYKANRFNLDYDEVFYILRYENIMKFFNIFQRNNLTREYGDFIRAIMTSQIYDRLHEKDMNRFNSIFRRTEE
jgi:hypothetical protein